MKRRFLLAASALGLSTTGTRAQRSGRVWRIGYLSGNSPPDPTMASFRLGMQRVGRTEGRDYEIFVRFADFQYERFPALIDELLADKVDIIITPGASTRAAPLAAKSVPVVFGFSGDPVAAGCRGIVPGPRSYPRSCRPHPSATGQSGKPLGDEGGSTRDDILIRRYRLF